MKKEELETEVERLTGELEKANEENLRLTGELEALQQQASDMAAAMQAKADLPPKPPPAPRTDVHWCSLLLDNNPADPRPPFDPVKGWDTPAVIEWGNRQRKGAV